MKSDCYNFSVDNALELLREHLFVASAAGTLFQLDPAEGTPGLETSQ